MSSSSPSTLFSEPHSYNIQAKLRNGILSIFVHDTMTSYQWRQEFTQISFPGHKLYHVAKALIMAIQEMINNTNNTKNNKRSQSQQHCSPKPISILVYNQWCYLTITNSNLPSFALRPIERNENNKENKPKQTKPSRHIIQLQQIQHSPYGFNANQRHKNIKFGASQRDKRINHNIKFKNNNQSISTPSTPSTPSIPSVPSIINKGLVARNIARFNQKEKQYKSNSSNSRKKHTKKCNKTKKCKNKTNQNKENEKEQAKQSKPAIIPPPNLSTTSCNLSPLQPIRPPTPSNMIHNQIKQKQLIQIINNDTNIGQSLPALPVLPALPPSRRLPFPSRPLPTLPTRNVSSTMSSIPIAQKMTVKNMDHSYSRSVKFGHNLTPTVQPRHSASATNNYRFHQLVMGNNKSLGIQQQQQKPSHIVVTVIERNNDIPNISNISNIQSIANMSNSSSSEYDDGLVINTDDEDSSSYKYEGRNGAHSSSNNGSMDSNTGSLDSLFTNDGADNNNLDNLDDLDDFDGFDDLDGLEGAAQKKESIASCNSNNTFFNGSYESISSKTSLPAKKMRLFNVMTNVDVDEQSETDDDEEEFCSDLFECDFMENDQNQNSNKNDKKSRFRSKKMWNHQTNGNGQNGQNGQNNTKWTNDENDGKQTKKKKKNKKKDNKKSKKPLKILLNGDVIEDMINHVIEQQIAEEEYYDEEDQADEPFYDPNYLGISPYYDD